MNKIPIDVEPIIFERLQRAVQFLEHAKSHGYGKTVIDRMVAIHGLDNSVEYLLRIVIDALDLEGVELKNLDDRDLWSILSEVKKFLEKYYGLSLPYISELKKLRKLRNQVQHGMLDPITDIAHLKSIVERFYDFCFNNLFGLDPNNMRLSQLIENKIISNFLHAAEENIEKRNYDEAIVNCRDAFENAYYDNQPNEMIGLNLVPILLSPHDVGAQKIYKLLVEELELLRLEVNPTQYRRYKKYIERIQYEKHLANIEKSTIRTNWNEQDAEFCYHFVSKTILYWQSVRDELISSKREPTTREIIDYIGGIEIYSSPVKYCLDDETNLILDIINVGKDIWHEISSKLKEGEEYTMVTERKEEEQLASRMSGKIKIESIHSQFIKHNPEIWEIVLIYKRIPSTWWYQSYKNGELEFEMPPSGII